MQAKHTLLSIAAPNGKMKKIKLYIYQLYCAAWMRQKAHWQGGAIDGRDSGLGMSKPNYCFYQELWSTPTIRMFDSGNANVRLHLDRNPYMQNHPTIRNVALSQQGSLAREIEATESLRCISISSQMEYQLSVC